MMNRLTYSFFFLLLLFSACNEKKSTDWSEQYSRNSKQPYGYHIAYQHLDELFPNAKIKAGLKIMAEVDAINKSTINTGGNILIAVAKSFQLDDDELNRMKKFVEAGNGVVILSEHYSENILDFFGVKDTLQTIKNYSLKDTIPNQLFYLQFNDSIHSFRFSGIPANHTFQFKDTSMESIAVLGYSGQKNHPNLLAYEKNQGIWFIHHSPIVFSNYFMLQNQNRAYYELLLSYLNEYPNSVSWFNYFTKSENETTQKETWTSLLKYPALRYAFFILLGLLLVYTLFQSKRKQRIIPPHESNANASLEFAETVGLLYLNTGNHKNLSDKMIQFYLENMRMKFGIRFKLSDDAFVEMLSRKTGHSRVETKSFVDYLIYIRQNSDIAETDIKHLYHQIQKFSTYGNTPL